MTKKVVGLLMNRVGIYSLTRIKLHKPLEVDKSEDEAFFAATHLFKKSINICVNTDMWNPP